MDNPTLTEVCFGTLGGRHRGARANDRSSSTEKGLDDGLIMPEKSSSSYREEAIARDRHTISIRHSDV